MIEDRSDTSEGEDLVFCKGACQRWLHRTCAGLTDPAFDELRNSDQHFYCYQCFVAFHKSEIKDLRNTVASLTKELSNPRSQLSREVSSVQKHYAPAKDPTPSSYSGVVSKVPKVTTTQDVPSPHLPPKPKPQVDHKFNLVIFGLDECPGSTPCRERIALDEEAVVHSLQQKIPSFTALSVRDCHRLGKYEHSDHSRRRPRPILVTLNRASDVSLVLSTRFPTGSIYVRPDLPPEVRHVQSIVREEHCSLIQQGLTDQSTIRIHLVTRLLLYPTFPSVTLTFQLSLGPQ